MNNSNSAPCLSFPPASFVRVKREVRVGMTVIIGDFVRSLQHHIAEPCENSWRGSVTENGGRARVNGGQPGGAAGASHVIRDNFDAHDGKNELTVCKSIFFFFFTVVICGWISFNCI